MSGDVRSSLPLKPCPFCGGHASMYVSPYDGDDPYTVQCEACGAYIQSDLGFEDAAGLWQSRVRVPGDSLSPMPCPFCWGHPRAFLDECDDGTPCWVVRCRSCRASVTAPRKRMALVLWDIRAPEGGRS